MGILKSDGHQINIISNIYAYGRIKYYNIIIFYRINKIRF